MLMLRTHLRRWLVGGLLFALAASLNAAEVLQTPLEKIGFSRVSQSAEMSTFLQALVQQDKNARLDIIGKTVQGRPIEALVLSVRGPASSDATRPRVMMIGSQHGAAEPAGGEAMLVIARDLVAGNLQHLRERMDIILIPNANPDGRDELHRSNANRININTDFVEITQPETLALKHALSRYKPDVLLDSHESAVLKRQTLAKEGYLTDFYAQFESANNPAIPASTRAFAFDVVMPELVKQVTQKGLPAHRYIGEITSIHQPITYGGLTLRNFRNTAGITGTMSFLVETKLDSREDTYPTFRNIGVRIDRQLICLRAFLDVVNEKQAGILQEVARLRASMPSEPVALKARYVKDMAHPEVAIPLRRLDTHKLETLIFADHRRMETSDIVPLPAYLAVTAHIDEVKAFLDKHEINYQSLQAPKHVQVLAYKFDGPPRVKEGANLLKSAKKTLQLPVGALLIDMSQPLGRMAFLLLDPRSISNMYQSAPYSQWLVRGDDFFVYPLIQAPAHD